ncbi:hypothetical protein [Candidatus Nitrososphaera evergladensis]|uniref:hypothetical protein n=1 Tax=Candidatus Nitrososphaera evergladensis TaxID=1459637 RepID=UPI0011E5D36B|nr:hypothetical protein [Candidatus Nitrososphaera evergladensis]
MNDSSNNRLVLPCGCVLNWSKKEGEVILCKTHDLQYESWRGSVENFVKMIATPRFRQTSLHVDSSSSAATQC